MRRKQQSGSSLILIELMITIAFFALTMAVFVQAFAMSHQKKEDARNLFEAQRLVSSAAEILEGGGDATEEWSVCFPQMYTGEQGELLAGYDEDWEAAKPKDACWFLIIYREGEKPMEQVHLSVEKPGEEVIYELSLDIYSPEETGGRAE